MPKKIEPRITKYMELCIICGKPAQWHHAIHTPQGSRDKATADGLLLPLCEDHHEGVCGAHKCAVVDTLCRVIAQLAWMLNQVATEEQKDELKKKFIERYGKSSI